MDPQQPCTDWSYLLPTIYSKSVVLKQTCEMSATYRSKKQNPNKNKKKLADFTSQIYKDPAKSGSGSYSVPTTHTVAVTTHTVTVTTHTITVTIHTVTATIHMLQ